MIRIGEGPQQRRQLFHIAVQPLREPVPHQRWCHSSEENFRDSKCNDSKESLKISNLNLTGLIKLGNGVVVLYKHRDWICMDDIGLNYE